MAAATAVALALLSFALGLGAGSLRSWRESALFRGLGAWVRDLPPLCADIYTGDQQPAGHAGWACRVGMPAVSSPPPPPVLPPPAALPAPRPFTPSPTPAVPNQCACDRPQGSPFLRCIEGARWSLGGIRSPVRLPTADRQLVHLAGWGGSSPLAPLAPSDCQRARYPRVMLTLLLRCPPPCAVSTHAMTRASLQSTWLCCLIA